MQALKALANQWVSESGGLTLWLMPYTTYRVNVISEELRRIVPEEQWDDFHKTFVNFEGSTVDIEINDKATREEQAFSVYWTNRNGDMRTNWELFSAVCGTEFLNLFWEARLHTRDHSMDAPPALRDDPAEDADPNA